MTRKHCPDAVFILTSTNKVYGDTPNFLPLVEKEMRLGDIRVVRKYDLNLPKILIDPDRMRQVFLNIINNAKYAMYGGGVLTISTLSILKDRRRKKRNEPPPSPAGPATDCIPFLRIMFADTGKGIKKEDMGKLFDPFFTTKPEDKGTGLGLSVCYTIIEKHSGTLEVESEYGHGAIFIIDLPFNVSEQYSEPIVIEI